MSIFFQLFTRFVFNPRIVLTELRVENGGLMSLAAAFFALATATLGHLLIYASHGGPLSWLIGSLISLLGLYATGVFYLSVIHYFAEKHMPGSRVTDLMIYAGFILAPLFLTLPLAFVCLLLPAPWVFYSMAMFLIFSRIFVSLIEGIRVNYHLSIGRALLAALSPVIILFVVPLIMAVLAILRYA